MRKILARVIPAALLGLSACKTGPDYQRPAVETPADWRWKVAQPSDHADKGEWWRVFAEPRLDAFQAQAAGQNQDLRAATARVEQARAVARVSRSSAWRICRSCWLPPPEDEADWLPCWPCCPLC